MASDVLGRPVLADVYTVGGRQERNRQGAEKAKDGKIEAASIPGDPGFFVL